MQRNTHFQQQQRQATPAARAPLQHCALADDRTLQRLLTEARMMDPGSQLHFRTFTAMLADEHQLFNAVIVGARVRNGNKNVFEVWKQLNWQVESEVHQAMDGSLKGITTMAATYITLWAHIPDLRILTIVSDDIAALSYPLKKFIEEKGGHCRRIVNWWISSAKYVDIDAQWDALKRNGVDVRCISKPRDLLRFAPWMGALRISNVTNQHLSKCGSRKVEPNLLGMMLQVSGTIPETANVVQFYDAIAKWAEEKLECDVTYAKDLLLESTGGASLPRNVVQVPLLIHSNNADEIVCPAIAKLLDLCNNCDCNGDVTNCDEARRKTAEPIVVCNSLLTNHVIANVHIRLIGISKMYLVQRISATKRAAAYRTLNEDAIRERLIGDAIYLPEPHRCLDAPWMQRASVQASMRSLMETVWSLGRDSTGPILHEYRTKLGNHSSATVLDIQNLLYGIQSVWMSSQRDPAMQGIDPRTRIDFRRFVDVYLQDTCVFARTGLIRSNRRLGAFLQLIDAEIHALTEEDGVFREHGVDEALVSDCVSLMCAASNTSDFTLQIASGDADVMVGAHVACECGVRVKILHFPENTSEFAFILARKHEDLVQDVRETQIDVNDTQMFYQKFTVHPEFNASRFLRFDLDFSQHEDRMRTLGEGCINEIVAELTSRTMHTWSQHTRNWPEVCCFVNGVEISNPTAREQMQRLIETTLSTRHMKLKEIGFAPLAAVMEPKHGWIAARLCAILTQLTKLPWMYREPRDGGEVFTFLVPAPIEDDRALAAAAGAVKRRLPVQVKFPRGYDPAADNTEEDRARRQYAAHDHNDENGFQVVADKRTRHAQQRDQRKREKHHRVCPYGLRCKRRFHCDFDHPEQHKQWFHWYEARYARLRLPIVCYKASPCRYICEYGQCDLAAEPWKCFGMHTLEEMWCPECQKQSNHPWHKCPNLTEEKKQEVLQRHQYLAFYDSMLAQGRFNQRRARAYSACSSEEGSTNSGNPMNSSPRSTASRLSPISNRSPAAPCWGARK